MKLHSTVVLRIPLASRHEWMKRAMKVIAAKRVF